MWVSRKRFEEMEKRLASAERRISEAYSALDSATNLLAWKKGAEQETTSLYGLYYGPQWVSAKLKVTDAIEAIAKHLGLELKYIDGTQTRAEFQKAKKAGAA